MNEKKYDPPRRRIVGVFTGGRETQKPFQLLDFCSTLKQSEEDVVFRCLRSLPASRSLADSTPLHAVIRSGEESKDFCWHFRFSSDALYGLSEETRPCFGTVTFHKSNRCEWRPMVILERFIERFRKSVVSCRLHQNEIFCWFCLKQLAYYCASHDRSNISSNFLERRVKVWLSWNWKSPFPFQWFYWFEENDFACRV